MRDHQVSRCKPATKGRSVFYSIIQIAFLFSILSQVFLARSIEVEGSAMITHNAVGKARVFAMQDAIRQAAVQANSHVTTMSAMSSSVMVMDSARVRAAGRVSNVVVIDEWTLDDMFYVRIRADVQNDGDTDRDSPMSYRKKVGAVQFHVVSRSDIQDLPEVERMLPKALLNRLEQKGSVIGIDGTNFLMYPLDRTLSSRQITLPDTKVVTGLAHEMGVQLIIAGIIRNMGVHSDFVGKSRSLELELQLFDGVSGMLIARHRFSDSIMGMGNMLLDVSFGSSEFYDSRYGQLVNRALDRQTHAMLADIAKLPFSARVILSKGKDIYFNAGAASRVQVGDVLMAYKLESLSLSEEAGLQNLGIPETPLATLTVKKVQPLFALGELETNEISLRTGDIVRFGW